MNISRCVVSFLWVIHSIFFSGVTVAETQQFALRIHSLDSQTDVYHPIGFITMSGDSLLVGSSKDQAIFKLDESTLVHQGTSQNQIHIKSGPAGALQLNSGKVIHWGLADIPHPTLPELQLHYRYVTVANENAGSDDFNEMYVFAQSATCPASPSETVGRLFMKTDGNEVQGCQRRIVFEMCSPGSS